MKLGHYRMFFVVVGLIGILLIASPLIGLLLHLPPGEPFSELYLLGSGHMAENYPFNVLPGENYLIYLDVGNHVGVSAYYVVYVKLQNESDLLSNTITEKPSPVEPLYEYRFFIENNQTLERPMTFSILDATFSPNQSIIRSVEINNVTFNVNKPAEWDVDTSLYHYRLLFELWKFNPQSGNISYDNRFVVLQLNLTKTS